jgi:hypothetical protein
MMIHLRCTDPKDEEDEEDRLANRRHRKKALVPLGTDPTGIPILPNPDDGEGMELREMAPMVRSYISHHYSQFCSNYI